MTLDFQRWIKRLLDKNLQQSKEALPLTTDYWPSMAKQAATLFAQEHSTTRLLELSHDGNGFVREGAVLALSSSYSVEVLSVIVERLNDWVPAVRKAARQVFEHYLSPVQTHLLLEGIEHIVMLETRQRNDHAMLLQQVQARLLHETCHQATRQHLPRTQGRAARFLFLGLYESSTGAERLELLDQAIQHHDLIIRRLAVQKCEAQQPDHAYTLLKPALSDAFPSIRRQALSLLFRMPLDQASIESLIRQGIHDRSAGVRELSRWYASTLNVNLQPHAEALRQRGERRTAAETVTLLELLALTNTENLNLVRTACQHRAASVRKTALSCLLKLSPEAALDMLRSALLDPSNKVFRVAALGLRKNDAHLSPDDLLTASISANQRHMPQRAIRIATLLPLWKRLDGLLRCYEAEPSEDCLKALTQWETRQAIAYSVSPDKAETTGIRERWRTLSLAGKAPPLTRLTFALRQFKLLD